MEALFFLLAGIFLGGIAVYVISQWILGKEKTKKEETSSFSSKEAEELLKDHGFKILDRGLAAPVLTTVDGRVHTGISPADFFAEKGRKAYVAHVHFGTLPAEINDPSLRRKFIESDAVYQPDGLLLVDMVEKSVQEVSFDFPKSSFNFLESFFRLVQVVFILAVILGIIWLMVYLKLF